MGNEPISAPIAPIVDEVSMKPIVKKCSYLKLNDCSARFIEQFGDALKANIRLHGVDSFVQTYKVNPPEEVVPSTKTIYCYIKEGGVSDYTNRAT